MGVVSRQHHVPMRISPLVLYIHQPYAMQKIVACEIDYFNVIEIIFDAYFVGND